jgi:hypothetical protein
MLHRPSDVRSGEGAFLTAKHSWGSVTDLTGYDSDEEHAPEEEELAGMQEDELKMQVVVEESIASTRRVE